MRSILDRIPAMFKNFYFVAGFLFLIWMLFFDSNDILTQFKLSSKQKDLQKTKDFYIEKIDEVKQDREALLNNEALLEKVAREKYYMKKSNEDVYVIVEKEK